MSRSFFAELYNSETYQFTLCSVKMPDCPLPLFPAKLLRMFLQSGAKSGTLLGKMLNVWGIKSPCIFKIRLHTQNENFSLTEIPKNVNLKSSEFEEFGKCLRQFHEETEERNLTEVTDEDSHQDLPSSPSEGNEADRNGGPKEVESFEEKNEASSLDPPANDEKTGENMQNSVLTVTIIPDNLSELEVKWRPTPDATEQRIAYLLYEEYITDHESQQKVSEDNELEKPLKISEDLSFQPKIKISVPVDKQEQMQDLPGASASEKKIKIDPLKLSQSSAQMVKVSNQPQQIEQAPIRISADKINRQSHKPSSGRSEGRFTQAIKVLGRAIFSPPKMKNIEEIKDLEINPYGYEGNAHKGRTSLYIKREWFSGLPKEPPRDGYYHVLQGKIEGNKIIIEKCPVYKFNCKTLEEFFQTSEVRSWLKNQDMIGWCHHVPGNIVYEEDFTLLKTHIGWVSKLPDSNKTKIGLILERADRNSLLVICYNPSKKKFVHFQNYYYFD